MPILYPYVGPEAIREQARGASAGVEIRSHVELTAWIAGNQAAIEEGATFVVMPSGVLRLAPRRSEHVACAGGQAVLAAGEMRFRQERGGFAIEEATNQSTGYCPEPDSFLSLAAALAAAALPPLPGWSHSFVFRRCPRCAQLALVKEDDFTCAACGAELPRERNLPTLVAPDAR